MQYFSRNVSFVLADRVHARLDVNVIIRRASLQLLLPCGTTETTRARAIRSQAHRCVTRRKLQTPGTAEEHE